MDKRLRGRHRFLLWLWAILSLGIMGAIFFFSAQSGRSSAGMSGGLLTSPLGRWLSRILPPLTGQGAEFDLRKYAHLFEYFCLGCTSLLFFHELMAGREKPILAALLPSLALCLAYAASDEIHQLFVPGRSGKLVDVFIDLLGAGIASLLLAPILRKIDKSLKDKEMGSNSHGEKDEHA